ncbi:MAG: alpha/beta fold hydrolase [Candidatus Limnocylindrales bacterium]
MTDTRLPTAVVAALDHPDEGRRGTVHAAGIPWSTLEWGDPAARPLLLIHGVTSSAATWWRVGPALAAAGRHAVAVDLPGHGRTGHWRGHHRFRDNAADVIAFVRAGGLERDDLQVIGHSWGAMTAAALPTRGLRPATIVLLDPPALPHAVMSAQVDDPTERTYDDLAEALAVIRATNPTWSDGDVRAKAEALTQVDEAAARSVLLDNGDWDGALSDLTDPAAAGIDVWIVRSDPTAGGYLPDAVVPRLEAIVGRDHIATIAGGPHSPQRTHPSETTAALLHALETSLAR